MSGKSSSSSQVISLPKGGGAQHGIGETFSPDLHTGTGNFTIPIALPAGRNGFQPQLNLAYSSGNGNGPFGLGWGFSIPGVSRKTSKGIPRYDDAKDTFLLSGAEDLVPVSTGPDGATRYRPRTEGLFARIEHHRDSQNNYWKVSTKDGLVSFYGTPESAGTDAAVVADPSNRTKVFAWNLTSTIDPSGNRIVYSYLRDQVQTEDSHHWDQLYLSEIRYVDHGDSNSPQFLVTVRFFYEERPDRFSEYRQGFEIRTVRRCTRIEILTHAEIDTLTRSYHFSYLDQQEVSTTDLPLNRLSFLSRVIVEGHDGDITEELPPLDFAYTQFQLEKRDFFPVTGPDAPPASLAQPSYELVDLFGNGLPSVFEMNGAVRYWRNLGMGRLALPREMRTAPAGLHLPDTGVQLVDANGDGRTDLLVTDNHGLAGYFPLRFGGYWDDQSFHRYRLAPSFNLEDPEVRLVDLDGDGVTDAIRSGTRLECFFNDSLEGWTDTRFVERQAVEQFPNVNFSDPRVKWADITGDGLQDILLVHDGNVEYWPNLGYGNWASCISMRNSPRFSFGYDPKRIIVGDVDGDGLADIVYVDDKEVTLWINQSGNSWSDPIVIQGTPPVSDMDAVRLVDMLGNGVSGVLWSTDASSGLSRERMFFLDFTGGSKSYLLREMNNNLGAVTRIGYAPSTRFYLEDEKQLETRWKTSLPFPVQVVARVEVIDASSGGKLTTEYSYHHGYWDGAEREFRGFGRVDQRDTEVFDDYHSAGLHALSESFAAISKQTFSPPTETRTWFHQGPIGDEFGEWEETDFSAEFWSGDQQELVRPAAISNFLKNLPRRARRDALRSLRGSVLRSELYALDDTERRDRPYTVIEHLYGVREESPPGPDADSRSRIFFPSTLAQRTTQWERGDEALTQFTFTDSYDEYGQPRSQINIAVPRSRNFRLAAASEEPYLCTHAFTTYAQRDDDQRYIVNREATITSYEILNDGSSSLIALKEAILSGSAARRVIGQVVNFYDGPAFQGLAFGQIGERGALMRSESLVLTESILHEAYKSGDTLLMPIEEPPYLSSSGAPAWTVEYPQEFREQLPPLAGYIHQTGNNSPYEAGYFSATDRRSYDFQQPGQDGRGLVKVTRDPLGHDTAIAFDNFDLLPTAVFDPLGLTTRAEYDYRVLQPREVIDVNDNHTRFVFTPLGNLKEVWVVGSPAKIEGDRQRPSIRMEYDFLAFINSPPEQRQPIFVQTLRHVHHDTETDVPLPDRDETIKSIEYSDGLGRLLQARTQAEDITFGDLVFGDAGLPADQSLPVGLSVGQQPGSEDAPRVVVSGWQTYDNKGRVVEKFEPFFSLGWDYAPPTDEQLGQKVTLHYDPRGQLIRTVNSDQSEQRVIYGIPDDLSNPDQFTPTPWEFYTYDVNDNAGRTHPIESLADQHHLNTPTSAKIDALGRTVETVARNRTPDSNNPVPAIDEHRTRHSYDLRGNLLVVTDALERDAFRYVYDLANIPLRVQSIDSGTRRSVLDAARNIVEHRNSKGALALYARDQSSRPVSQWARDAMNDSVTLRERLEYGDASDPAQPQDDRSANRFVNRLGRLHRHYDEAGLLTLDEYDFKGNISEKARQVISDESILSVFTPAPANWAVPAFRVDWQPPVGTTLDQLASALLDGREYRTSVTYDALNRIETVLYPRDVDNERKQLLPQYNRAGALESVLLDGTSYVERIAYNAKGQRVLIAYGNGVMTRHAYDAQTFRLARLRTERFSHPPNAELTYQPEAQAFQDFAYRYDLAGNILEMTDRVSNCGVLNNPEASMVADPQLAQLLVAGDALLRHFEYDALYRLSSATGRECDTQLSPAPWDDMPKCQDVTLARAYTESYSYDRVGNMTQLAHQANAGSGSFTRNLLVEDVNNRLVSLSVGASNFAYVYDTSGNLISETSSRHFEWDHADRMRVYRTQPDGAEPSVHAHYLYDSGGQRVKKLVRRQGGQVEVAVYVDSVFEHHRVIRNGTTEENNTLHVMDNQGRIAMLRVGTPFADDTTPAIKFHLGDHLGSSNIVLDAGGNLINREEYTPYGETCFGSFAKKRYRLTGKERDEESGLYYHGERYYAPWLARWASCDPAGMVDGVNLYQYCLSNPVRFKDSTGLESVDLVAEKYMNDAIELQEKVHAARENLDKIGAEYDATQEIYHATNQKNLQPATLTKLDELKDQARVARNDLDKLEQKLSAHMKEGTKVAGQINKAIVNAKPSDYRTNPVDRLRRLREKVEGAAANLKTLAEKELPVLKTALKELKSDMGAVKRTGWWKKGGGGSGTGGGGGSSPRRGRGGLIGIGTLIIITVGVVTSGNEEELGRAVVEPLLSDVKTTVDAAVGLYNLPPRQTQSAEQMANDAARLRSGTESGGSGSRPY